MTKYEQILIVTDEVFIFDDGSYMSLKTDIQSVTESESVESTRITPTGYASVFCTFDGADESVR